MSIQRWRFDGVDLYRHGEGRWVKYDDHVVEVGQWAATVARVTNERDDEHLARVKAEAEVERQAAIRDNREKTNEIRRLHQHRDELSADRHRHLLEIRRLDAEVERLRAGVKAVQALIRESDGVAGLHLNGDIAPWSTLLAGGHYEEWLRDLSAALEAFD